MSGHYEGQRALCRLCKKPIVWEVVDGKPKPFDADWRHRSHFTTCKKWWEMCAARDAAKKAEKEKGQGRLF